VTFVAEELGAGKKRDVVLLGDGAGGVFEAEGAHLVARGTDEYDSGGEARVGEGGILGKETVAGMDGLSAGGLRGSDDFVNVEITLRGRGGADVDGFVGLLHVERVLVGVGVDRNGCDAHATERANDSAGDGAAICD
jgi:hypothetical protein